MTHDVLCIGEILWDALPEGLFLGGAPFNVACHLHTLGGNVAVASRVGDDVLGAEALRRLGRRGMATDLVQIDPELETGFVEVEVDGDGVPAYVIREPTAWDAIALDDALEERAEAADVIVFGSLAQRSEVSRNTIRAVVEHSSRKEQAAMKVYDVNLRQPFATWSIVKASLEKANVVKMSEEELRQIMQWASADGADEPASVLGVTFGLSVVCVTRGSNGAQLWKDGKHYEHPGYTIDVTDTVGVGDAFLAGLIHGMLAGLSDGDLLDFANRLGAYVATQVGPTPTYTWEDIDAIRHLSLSN